MISVTCDGCGSGLKRFASRVRPGKRNFCSKACGPFPRARPLVDRFWERVDKNGPAPEHMPHLGPCWLWLGKPNANGYGTLGRSGKNPLLAHRVSWLLAHGDPGDLFVCHRCDTKICVRAGHLFLGTHTDNMRDMRAKDRGRVKLTREDVLAIRALRANGALFREIAARYRVSLDAARKVARGITWAHVE